MNQIPKLLVILTTAVLIAGCKPGGDGGGSSSEASSNSGFSTTGYDGSATTPEPSTLALFGMGLGALAATMLRKKKN